jgi:hypothetical protein
MGRQVSCSRCKAVFTAEPYQGPKKSSQGRGSRTARNTVLIFALVMAVAGTVAVVFAALVFLFNQWDRYFLHPKEAEGPVNRGPNFNFNLPQLVEPDPDEKSPGSDKPSFPTLTLQASPPRYSVPAAVDRPVNLQWQPVVGEFVLTLASWLDAQEQTPSGANEQLESRTLAQFSESIQAVIPNEQAGIRLRYQGYRSDADRAGVSRTMAQASIADLSTVSAFLVLNEKGEPTAHKADLSRVAKESEGAVKKVHEHQQSLLDFFAIPLPNLASARLGTTWTYQRMTPLQWSEKEGVHQAQEVVARLQGSCRRGTEECAVVELRTRQKSGLGIGVAEGKGWVLISTATGMVIEAQAEVPFAVTRPAGQEARSVKGALHLSFQRRLPPPPLEENN